MRLIRTIDNYWNKVEILTLGVTWSAIPDTVSDTITENILDKLKSWKPKVKKAHPPNLLTMK